MCHFKINISKTIINFLIYLLGYIIERREAGSNFWFKANDFPCADCHYTVMNLMENSEYEFRVFAVNAAGKSDPSACTNPVKVCEVAGKYSKCI